MEKQEKHIIYETKLDYKQGEEYINEEKQELEKVLDELGEKGWLGGVLKATCEKKLDELKLQESYNISEQWYMDERDNLDQETGEIVIVADLGLWSGRVAGVKSTGKHNLNVILEQHGDIDDYEVYMERGEIKGTGYHHDGTNYYTFREVIDQEKWEKLAEKIAAGESWTAKELDAATKSLAKRVADIYGWEVEK